MAMYWTNERLSELIAQFRAHPVLWNPKHDNYRDRLSKSRAWDDIASNLRVERYVCERKMNILRTQFRREWNRKKFSLLNGKIARESKWYAYRSLQFLEGVEQRGFRHRFNNPVDNLHNIASVLQLNSKWPNINRRFQQSNVQSQLDKQRRIEETNFCEQLQNVKCETISNPDDENNDEGIAGNPLNDEYPQDYSLHQKLEMDGDNKGDIEFDNQETSGHEGNMPELRHFNETGLKNDGLINTHKTAQCISPKHVYGQTSILTINRNSLSSESNLNQPSDLSVQPSNLTSTMKTSPDTFSIQPFSLTSHSNTIQNDLSRKPEVTFTQICNKNMTNTISTHSNSLQKSITSSYSNISQPGTSNAQLSAIPTNSVNSTQAHSNSQTKNIITQPNFTTVQATNFSKHSLINNQINVITTQSSTNPQKTNTSSDQTQINQVARDNITTKPNVKVCPRRSSTVTPNIRTDQPYPSNSSTWRPTNNLRLRRRTLINRIKNNTSVENDDLNDLIRSIVREEVHSSTRNIGTTRDESISYGEHVGFRLQRLSARARSIVTHLIDGILYEADMGIYDTSNNTVSNQHGVEHTSAVKTEDDHHDT